MAYLLSQATVPGDRAVFRQIAAHLREAIEDGRLGPGERLPSESALVAHYGVTHATARAAVSVLRTEGLVYARHGRGVFVRTVAPLGRTTSTTNDGVATTTLGTPGPVTTEQVSLTVDEANRLDCRPGEPALRTRCEHLNTFGNPVGVTISLIPHRRLREVEVGAAAANPEASGLIEEQVQVRRAVESDLALGVELGDPVVVIERLTVRGGLPVEFRTEQLAGDGLRLRYYLCHPGQGL